MKIRHDRKQLLGHNEKHIIPMQVQRYTRGHQMHLDITEHKDPNTTIHVLLEASLDNGKTWLHAGEMTLRGGHYEIDKNGLPVTYSASAWGTHEHPVDHKLMRGTVSVLPTDPSTWDSHQMRVSASLLDNETPQRLRGTYSDDMPLELNSLERTVMVDIPHPAPGIAKMFSTRPSTPVNTRIHLVGIKSHQLNTSLIPTD